MNAAVQMEEVIRVSSEMQVKWRKNKEWRCKHENLSHYFTTYSQTKCTFLLRAVVMLLIFGFGMEMMEVGLGSSKDTSSKSRSNEQVTSGATTRRSQFTNQKQSKADISIYSNFHKRKANANTKYASKSNQQQQTRSYFTKLHQIKFDFRKGVILATVRAENW